MELLYSELLYSKVGTLAGNGSAALRLCPWDDTNTHVTPGSRIRFRFDVRAISIASVHSKLYVTNSIGAPSVPFNPLGPMRNLDRDVVPQDNILLVDELTPVAHGAPAGGVDLDNGFVIWQEMGAVDEHNSPTLQISQDTTNRREFDLVVTNQQADPVPYTIEVYAEII